MNGEQPAWTEELARIDRAQAEIRKFAAEQNKLAEEASRRYVADYVMSAAVVVAAAADLVAAAPVVLRLVGPG